MRRSYLHPMMVLGCLFVFVFACIWSVATIGTEPVTQIDQGVYIDVQDYSLDFCAPLWRDEIARRFPDAVGILCHGGDAVDGQWVTSAFSFGHNVTVRQLVERERRLRPGRPIVVLCCNTGHLRPNLGSDVYYALSNVWCLPDRALRQGDVSTDLILGPTTEPAPVLPETESPWDKIFPSLLPSLPKIVVIPPPPPTRWQTHPDWVGNIFEFVHD
jgi:hypothetical protein